MTTDNRPSGFDEQRVLAELEQLQRDIQASRRRRQEVVEEFDAFVRGFRAVPPAAVPDGPAAVPPPVSRIPQPPPVPAHAEVVQASPPPPRIEVIPPSPPAQASSSIPPAIPDELFEARSTTARGWESIHLSGGLAALRSWPVLAGVAVVALVIFLFTRGSDGPQPAPVAEPAATSTPGTGGTSGQERPAPTAAADGAAKEAFPEAPAPLRGALQVEMAVLRPVWMRVTVDGRVEVEQLVPQGRRLRFGADRAVVVRAGDAGAVRLTIDGRDAGFLGRDGQVLTRTLAPRPR